MPMSALAKDFGWILPASSSARISTTTPSVACIAMQIELMMEPYCRANDLTAAVFSTSVLAFLIFSTASLSVST